MFGDLMRSNDFSEDGGGCLWKDVFLAQHHRKNNVGISDHATSVERTVFTEEKEEEESSLRYSMESHDYIDDLFTFDHIENCTEDYRFSRADQNSQDTFLPTFGVNMDPDETFCDSAEGQCMLTQPSFGSYSPDAESFPDEINIDDCDVFEDFNTELNCDSTSATMSSVNSEEKEAVGLPTEFVCVAKDVVSYSNESHNDVNRRNTTHGKQNIFVKVVKKHSSELTTEIANSFDNGRYGSHAVIEADFETDLRDMRRTRGEEPDTGLNRNAKQLETDLRDMRRTRGEEPDTGLNRNAIQARINRAKKKAYIARLEEELQKLNKEKDEMKRKIDTFEEKEANLIAEVQYLKSVLSNDSMLANLISNIGGVNSVELTSPTISHHKRKLDLTRHSETSKRFKPSVSSEGICLHVCQDRLSLELCHHCAHSSRTSIATNNNRCKH